MYRAVEPSLGLTEADTSAGLWINKCRTGHVFPFEKEPRVRLKSLNKCLTQPISYLHYILHFSSALVHLNCKIT